MHKLVRQKSAVSEVRELALPTTAGRSPIKKIERTTTCSKVQQS